MVLKYSFELFFLKCIFIHEFMINIPPSASNSVNGRGKYFNAINIDRKIGPLVAWPSGQGPHFFAGGSWGATGFKPRRHYSFFFFLSFFHRFFTLWLFTVYSHC